MKISEMIKKLETAKEEYGDRELFMWVDSGEDTLFLAKVPKFDFKEIDGKEFDIDPKHWKDDLTQNVLCITNLDSNSFNEDEDSVQVLEEEEVDKEEFYKLVEAAKAKQLAKYR